MQAAAGVGVIPSVICFGDYISKDKQLRLVGIFENNELKIGMKIRLNVAEFFVGEFHKDSFVGIRFKHISHPNCSMVMVEHMISTKERLITSEKKIQSERATYKTYEYYLNTYCQICKNFNRT